MLIELDTVVYEGDYRGTAEDAGRKITEGYAVTFTVVTESGPAGGHPVIRYEGEEAELRRMVAEHYGPDTVTDYFTPRKRDVFVRHVLESSDTTTKAGLRNAVDAIVREWELDVERIKREWDPSHGE